MEGAMPHEMLACGWFHHHVQDFQVQASLVADGFGDSWIAHFWRLPSGSATI